MPTAARPENHLIRLFVSACDNGSWKDAILTFPDEVKDGGIDGYAERTDGTTLAIEHTVVEPFVGDIADQAEMVAMFPRSRKMIPCSFPISGFASSFPSARSTCKSPTFGKR